MNWNQTTDTTICWAARPMRETWYTEPAPLGISSIQMRLANTRKNAT